MVDKDRVSDPNNLTGAARYNRIGRNYSQFRRTEPTWHNEIANALGGAKRVLNVGAGTGNYEDLDADVVALEPSPVMTDQRPPGSAPCVRGVAEQLPFADDAFDATMGVLTMHHWYDFETALTELERVAPRHVYTVYDTAITHDFWLVDYFPEMRTMPMEVNAPTPERIDEALRVVDVRTLWVPRECNEGFVTSAWARPQDYLDPERQEAMSMFALATPEGRARGTALLAAELESGEWHRKYPELLTAERADFGYRLVTAERR